MTAIKVHLSAGESVKLQPVEHGKVPYILALSSPPHGSGTIVLGLGVGVLSLPCSKLNVHQPQTEELLEPRSLGLFRLEHMSQIMVYSDVPALDDHVCRH